jgi:2-keto-4-pentenoate hydratase/2-oxohepta-3-ene-1,7-dioic acid hydratase in catechol pathway
VRWLLPLPPGHHTGAPPDHESKNELHGDEQPPLSGPLTQMAVARNLVNHVHEMRDARWLKKHPVAYG